jgi:hypothetical protein
MSTAYRDSRASRSSAGDSRATLRKPVKLAARMRGAGSLRFDITVVDLSLTGFRAETYSILRPGTLVWITLPGFSALEAEVAWQRGEAIGCRFRQSLHPAVFDHICDLGR